MPVCGTTVLPSSDTFTPESPTPSDLLTPLDFQIPIKPRYYLSELAAHLCRCEETPELQRVAMETAQRALERLCERGKLRGLRLGRMIIIPRAEWERYVAENNTLVCDN